jgi:hypothetical protein
VIYDATDGITDITNITDIILTINITDNTTVYQKGDFSLYHINNNTALLAEIHLGEIGTSQTVNFSIAAANFAGDSYATFPGEFYTRRAAFKYLVFDPPTASVLVNNELTLNVLALDDNRELIVGQEISFNFNSANNGGAAFAPETVFSGSGGWAQTKLKSGNSENITLEIQAWSAGISSNILTVTVNPLLRIVKNINLNTEYVSIRAALEDPALADGHTLEISSNYALAEPEQKNLAAAWPNKNNLTLKADSITINSPLNISNVSNLTVTLDGLIFNGLTKPLVINNPGGTINIVNSVFSGNSGGAIDATTSYLKIENSVFNNNTASDGGAL